MGKHADSSTNSPRSLGAANTGGQPAARYVLQQKLASGGMGTVYRVLDTVTGLERALKRMSAEAALDKPLIEAFKLEYQVLASLDHPRIIRVFDYGVDELGPYYTMELIEGGDLKTAAPISYREACLYLRDVATCLALLHARRLIHRDLSPTNVRLTGDGHCKLLDFGALVPFGRPDAIVGTPPVIAPEALDGAPLDQRADLYALGALGYWVLTGQHAYPARSLPELLDVWRLPPVPPSSVVSGIPIALDELVLSLLSLDPLARPGSAAEVIARLNAIAELAEEDTTETERLAQSFLLNPRFMGRTSELSKIHTLTESATRGYGAAVCIKAPAGMGRTRLLEEIAVRAQLAGATVLRADASMYRFLHGTSKALVLRLFDALPKLARERAPQFLAPLHALGADVATRMSRATPESSMTTSEAEAVASLEGWFVDISRTQPLAVLVDNIDYADDASLGLLASLAKLAATSSVLVVVTGSTGRGASAAIGLVALEAHSALWELPALDVGEIFELTRSLFGDTPNLKRFAEWLYGRTAGSPLHAVEIVRQLVAKQVIRYSGGLWTLPVDKPDADVPAALEDALSMRTALLSDEARALAECVSLQREQPSLELCRLIAQQPDDRHLFLLLDELARNDVLYADRDGYRFSSMALRDVLFAGMAATRLAQNHRRLGEAFATIAGADQRALQIEAGWHLIQGGHELVGADMIAAVTHDAVTIGMLLANMHRAGRALEAALAVYDKYGRSDYERMPLLSSLAQAGFYEERAFAEVYGDPALEILVRISGLRLARRLRPWFGRRLALVLAILCAGIRFKLVSRSERQYSFANLLVHLFGVVTRLTATASLSLDVERAAHVAEVLEPFSVLPERLTPVGIYQFCKGLSEIGRDNEAAAYEIFDKLLKRFQDPRYYPTLPEQARKLYIDGAHFARASFAIFRAHGETAVESIDALERTGSKLYSMIGSQLRFLYYMNRGEFVKAAPHREQAELHAAHLGSIWQVETWEAPALLLVYTALSDIVSCKRVAHQLERLSRTLPSLKRYEERARETVMRALGDRTYTEIVGERYRKDAPRSYIGWGSSMGTLARGYNELGRHAEAKEVCEQTLMHLTDADLEFTAHFLGLDIQLAIANAGLGDFAQSKLRVDSLLERFKDSDHPLVLGLLHEVLARICFANGDRAGYEENLAMVERWFLPTGTPALIAKCKRLAELKVELFGDSRALPQLQTGVAHERTVDGSDATVDDLFVTRTLCGTQAMSSIPPAA